MVPEVADGPSACPSLPATVRRAVTATASPDRLLAGRVAGRGSRGGNLQVFQVYQPTRAAPTARQASVATAANRTEQEPPPRGFCSRFQRFENLMNVPWSMSMPIKPAIFHQHNNTK